MKKVLVLALVLIFALQISAIGETEYTIGIAQFAEHGSLDNCRTGVIEGLKEAGFIEGENVTYVIQNAQADMGVANQVAQYMAETTDMVVAIATPIAMAAFNACQDSEIPVIYTAVSDPVAAQLANEQGTNEFAITGSSDQLPVKNQLTLIRAMMPKATKIGILYTTSETNSESTLKTYQELAGEFGFEIIPSGVASGADLPAALDVLLPKVDCTTNLTDNTVVTYLPIVLEKSAEAGKPVFGSEIEQVKMGCVASEGLDYIALGKQTGKMAARVLNGEFAGDIPFEMVKESALYINPEAMQSFNLTLPEAEMQRAIDVLK